MFFHFPYQKIGFSEEEWEKIPRNDRCVIRDYYLNGRNIRETTTYGFYETPWTIRKVIRIYKLKKRPQIKELSEIK